jgi:lipoprotein-anchoring transpeptidase ErfK/SrfK
VSRGAAQIVTVGNDMIIPRSRLVEAPEPAMIVPEPLLATETIPIESIHHQESIPVTVTPNEKRESRFSKMLDTFHEHSVITFALLFLIVGSTGIIVGGRYWSARVLDQIKPLAVTAPLTHIIPGLSLAVPASKLQAELQSIGSQNVTITVGSNVVPVSPDLIKSWIKVTPSGNKVQDYLQINSAAINSSLLSIAKEYVAAPVNQVSVTHTDGVSPSGIILAGQNGTSLSNPSNLAVQAQQSASNIMNSQGAQFNTPLATVPFQSVTPSAFSKLLEADVSTNRLYAWQNGQLIQTFLTTDGRPGDPTPIGEFHIWAKLTSQTMTGPGYVQPNVPWINYFDHSGDAIHGNYWRPQSVFGAVRTSHGCIGVPVQQEPGIDNVSQAEWIYNWAPIGTTVITYLAPTT